MSQARSQWDCHRRGFTLVEVLVTITLISTGILVLGGMLLRSARAAEAASAVSYQTAAMASEVARLDALPFTALAAGTTCDTLAVAQLPRIRCSIVAVVSPKVTRVTVRITAIGNPLIPADSVIFERSISGDVVPPLNTP
ncbi:MAG TPA: prepilin-type N-terminal cleavage/methylation domain-containing protein [Gemmatimonadales bacterium]|nr:prepilin-type N-terminal cleavage/methylation domain-containing protein [Gemmatimonadales bacterium]